MPRPDYITNVKAFVNTNGMEILRIQLGARFTLNVKNGK